MKVALITLGCKVNAYETEAVWEHLHSAGYERVEANKFADIYIVNTCMVTNTAEAKSRQMIRHPLKYNPNAIIVVMGCLTQLKADAIISIDGVKIVLGTKDRDLIPDYIERYLHNLEPINYVKDYQLHDPYDNLVINDFYDHQRAFLKIEDGCNNFCSYCIIPYTRGRVRSKPKELVLNEAKELSKRHIEIILTGIHTGGYGEDLEDYSFSELLVDLETIEGPKRIRISSIEINELTKDVIKLIAKSDKFVHHLHVPMQSGSDKILKLMNRKYSRKQYMDKISELRNSIPDLSLTTDVIVGFPGETEADFVDALEFIELIGFNELHVFPYSQRSGTASARLTGVVDGNVKKNRVHRLLALGEKMAKQAIQDQTGNILHVVVEREKNGYLMGHSRNYVHVRFKGNISLVGTEVDVLLTKENYPISDGLIK